MIINTSAKNMFRQMTESVLRAKIVFYDSNPIGRIVTRFSKDITVIDLLLTFYTIMITFGILKLVTTVIVVAIVNPYVLIPAFAMFALMIWLIRFASPALLEAQRLDSVIRGPIHSMFAMVVGGLVSLRAMSRLDYFSRGFQHELEKGTNVTFTYNGVNRWIS